MTRQSSPDQQPNRGGRPRLIDEPSRVDRSMTNSELILQYIRLGAPFAIASRAAGIGEQTFHEWRRRGTGTDRRDDPDGRFAKFAADVEQAESESVLRLVMALREAVTGDPYEVTTVRTKQVRDEDGRLVPVTEQTTTRGVKRYPRTAEWLLARRAPEYFGQQAAQLPLATETVTPVDDGAVAALERSWVAYQQGREDQAADEAEARKLVAGNGANDVT